MNLGKNIKKYRTKIGLTQKELADKLHVTPQAVSRWELDSVEPSLDTIKDMALLFNIDYNELMGEDGQIKESQDDLQAQINAKLDTLLANMENTTEPKPTIDINTFIANGETHYASKFSKATFSKIKLSVIILFFIMLANFIINLSIGLGLKNNYPIISYVDFIFTAIILGFAWPIFLFKYSVKNTTLQRHSHHNVIKNKHIDFFVLNSIIKGGWIFGLIIGFTLEVLLMIACCDNNFALLIHLILIAIQFIMGIAIFVLYKKLVMSYEIIIFDGTLNYEPKRFILDLTLENPKILDSDHYCDLYPEKSKYAVE